MDGLFNENFHKSLQTGFVNKVIESELAYRPQLLTNKAIPKEKVLSTLLQEFDTCDAFLISVAFVTTSGIAVLLNSLLSLEKRNIKGKILVSQYLNFTQPEALKKLKTFKNIELKISTTNNAHSKGYIFKKRGHYNIIVGSSNLTSQALTVNKEWNLKVSGLVSSSIVNDLLSEFDNDFEKATLVTEKFISAYQIEYDKGRIFNQEAKIENSSLFQKEIIPNSMQLVALENLKQLRLENKTKALIISATGTGKTYLSAFDVKNFGSKKLLFVVHRLNIAQHSLETFKKLFKNDRTFGIYSGDKKELKKDFIFSTVQTISKEENLQLFEKNAFDYIIIDESHRSGADSYRRLIDYFRPKFLLGMTATPERTDGNDIFSLFDHNIGYEIRLNKAMEEGMLSEFHYYGVADLIVNNEAVDDIRHFKRIEIEDRVEKIIQNAKLYGSDNGITRGLVFCSSNAESSFLSERFNNLGFKTVALSGESTEAQRNDAITRLESNNNHERLDYIFTVDIFNEGIDIPKVNQILMIRPTDSAIIFVQQLGRGLRKAEGKDYLTVVDFIGNHKNNYLIPIALYGDTSYNKDTLRKLISEGSKMLPGSSTINFDEITKERIYESIDSANMCILSDLKKDYQLLKYRLGRMPMMVDFLNHDARDPFLFVEYAKSYYNFVKKVDTTFEKNLDKKSSDLLELFSKEINNGKRVEESFVLQALLVNNELSIQNFIDQIFEEYGYKTSPDTIDSLISNLNFNFIRKSENIIYRENDVLKLHAHFLETLKNKTFREFLVDSLNYSIDTFKKVFTKENYKQGLILYNKYSRKDVCRLLNWDSDISSTIYGYRTKNEATPCFVTYHKSNDIVDSINYNDHFINPSVFAWESRSDRKVESQEIQNVIHSKRILLFVKKEDAEGADFYYMGDVSIITNSVEQAIMPQSRKSVVHFKFKLEKPVPDNLYKYITEVSIQNPGNSIDSEKEVPLSEATNTRPKFTIPFYDLYAAAGNFSELQSVNTFSQLEVDEKYAKSDDYFALKVVGESMNRRIPNGSICIFKKYSGGSRNGKIVLIENKDIQDPDFKASFTVKTYSSQKSIKEEQWGHDEIVLKPNSFDKKYTDIILTKEQAQGMKVIAEFITIVNI
jgi:superfamily II DNA or RNA helicase/HKD family nuclease/phage repressor protein C with HTH and peptisase S24 domain